jgi:hypothetical protein
MKNLNDDFSPVPTATRHGSSRSGSIVDSTASRNHRIYCSQDLQGFGCSKALIPLKITASVKSKYFEGWF